MFNLVLNDIAISKRAFVVALIACFTMNLFFINAPAFVYVVTPPLISYEFFKNSCAYDYKYNLDIMFNSLPVSRRDIVLSKYIDSIVFLIFSIIITTIFTFIFSSINISGPGVSAFIHVNELLHLNMVDSLMNFQTISMSCIIITALLIAIYIPIYFKFEYLKVRNVFAIVSILIYFIPILFIKIIGDENTYKFVNYFSSVSGVIASIVIISISFLMLYISVNISIKFYESRDL